MAFARNKGPHPAGTDCFEDSANVEKYILVQGLVVGTPL